jgi:hypothetical protein
MTKMYRSLFSFLLAIISISASSQNVAINNTGAQPNQSAIVDINSSSKGLLIPRLTASQRVAIAMPAKGLLVYQTNTPEGFYYNSGTTDSPEWIQLGATGPQGPQGMAGPVGASGIIQSYTYAGAAANLPDIFNKFISPTLTITILQGQKVYLSVSQAMGGYLAARDLCIYPACQMIAPAGPLTNLNLGLCGLEVPANTRTTFSVNGVFDSLPAGTYKFGMAGFRKTTTWTNNEWGCITALVF